MSLFDLFWLKLFQKRKRKNSQKKKKKADQKPVGAEMQGCPAQSGKFLIETENKMMKKAGHLSWSCICSRVGRRGDWLN